MSDSADDLLRRCAHRHRPRDLRPDFTAQNCRCTGKIHWVQIDTGTHDHDHFIDPDERLRSPWPGIGHEGGTAPKIARCHGAQRLSPRVLTWPGAGRNGSVIHSTIYHAD